MAPQRNARSTPAEISLAHLKSCLVNLPTTLESLLVNLNTVRTSPPFVDDASSMPATGLQLNRD